MIQFKQVTKSFGDRVVLNQISFSVRTGEIIFVIGKSGTGKSVLLKNIVGLMKPDGGEIWVGEDRVDLLDEKDLLRVRKRCGMVFQHPALIDSLTIFDNVAFGIRAHGLKVEETAIGETVRKMLGLVHFDSKHLARRPSELSFGMQKMVSIARALAIEPNYLLFDEPTTGQDPVTTTAVNTLISELSRKLNVTAIVVSHDMHSALKYADRILMLHSGGIVAEGTPNEMTRSTQGLVNDFLKGEKQIG